MHPSAPCDLEAEETGPRRLFYSVDANFRFTFVSKGAAELWDWPATLLLGQVLWEAFPTAAKSEGYDRHQAAMRDRVSQDYRAFSPRYGRWYHFTIHPLDTGGLICFFHEETETLPPPDEGSRAPL